VQSGDKLTYEQFRTNWNGPLNLGPLTYKCGHCGNKVGGSIGWFGGVRHFVNGQGRVYICPVCTVPSIFFVVAAPGSTDPNVLFQLPAPAYGEDVGHLPTDVAAAYDEARKCYKAGAFIACVTMCRKLLMHVAVDVAKQPLAKPFAFYVDALVTGGFIAVPNKPWVDKIRTIGNDANHDLTPIDAKQAEMILEFSAMLLKTLYEYAAIAATPSPQTTP
jgi:hypothetical protein